MRSFLAAIAFVSALLAGPVWAQINNPGGVIPLADGMYCVTIASGRFTVVTSGSSCSGGGTMSLTGNGTQLTGNGVPLTGG